VRPALLIVVITLAACAGTPPISLQPEAESSVVTLQCDDGWDGCYSQANKLCGSRGFDEVDRQQTERLTSSGRSMGPATERDVYREDNRAEIENRVLTIRCL